MPAVEHGPARKQPAALIWVFVPAVVMSLGWGLRGYIGGGPYGAMIPGLLMSLMLCQYLQVGRTTASLVVSFAAIGIGFGGNMTYGQTLGLIRVEESFLWGLTGTTIKGAVWGFLGGSMLGLGFVVSRLPSRHLAGLLGCLLCGITIGIALINAPKLIYFSNPIDKPRDESWAGLLVGAFALLTYLRVFQPQQFRVPAIFAFYGTVSGGLGFGLGSLFLAWQSQVSEVWRWLPFWKFMEFSFGLLLGGGLGLAAHRLRNHLCESNSSLNANRAEQSPVSGVTEMVAGAGVVLLVFFFWPRLTILVYSVLGPPTRDSVAMTATDVMMDFTGMGCVMLLLSRRWPTVAWQLAVSVTIVAAMIDWLRDLLPRGEINMPEPYRILLLLATAAGSVMFVAMWLHKRNSRLEHLFLFASCTLMGIGYMMGLGRVEIWWPVRESMDAAGGQWQYLWQQFRSEIVVHSIFTTLFILSLSGSLLGRQAEHD